MSIGAIIQLILSIASQIPSLISIIQAIIKAIGGLKPAAQSGAMSDLALAYKKAVDTGDTSDLHAVHDRLCNSVGTPPQPVGNT